MLVILHGPPVAAPGEAPLRKKLIAQIVLVDLVGEVQASVREGRSGGGRDPLLSARPGHIGIVQGIDVDGVYAGCICRFLE